MHVSLDSVWDGECVAFMHLTRKIVFHFYFIFIYLGTVAPSVHENCFSGGRVS